MKKATCCLLLLCLVACEAKNEGPPPSPIVVYAPGDAGSNLATMLGEFTKDTGIPVSVKWGNSVENTDAVINKTGVPADILITDNVADIWRAADEGALRPISSGRLDDISEKLRDQDGYWAAFSVYPAVLATSNSVSVDEGKPFHEHWQREDFCVLSSAHALSRAYIANQVHAQGAKQAERHVRRMVSSLDAEPFEDEEELLEALQAGDCGVALLAGRKGNEPLNYVEIDMDAVVIDAVGVGRHARYADSAQRFVDWLLREQALRAPSAMRTSVNVAGFRDIEAKLLAERAGYR